MTAKELKLLRLAWEYTGRIVVTKLDVIPGVRIESSFKDRNGAPFVSYAYSIKRKIYLTDGGSIVGTLQKSGMTVEMKLVQAMLRSYGLDLVDNDSVIEQSDRPLNERVAALFQAWAAVDGVMRTWARGD